MSGPLRSLVLPAVCLITLSHSVPAAAQCSLEERYYADCLLSKFTAEAAVMVREPRFRINLPNLFVRGIDVSVYGVVSVEVENNGAADAPAYEVVVGAYLDTVAGQSVDSFETSLQFPALPAGGRYETQVGTLYVPDHEQDRDVAVVVLVDKMDLRDPGGQIWETNEEDNIAEYECRIFGPNPDMSGPPGC